MRDCPYCVALVETEASLREALREIKAHMGACIVQRIASDDAIIFEHIVEAEKLASAALSR